MPPNIIFYLMGALFLLFLNQPYCVNGQIKWEVDYGNNNILSLPMKEQKIINVKIRNLDVKALVESAAVIRLVSNDIKVVKIPETVLAKDIKGSTYEGPFTIDATFIGNTEINVVIDYVREHRTEYSQKKLYVQVYRRKIEYQLDPIVSHILNVIVFFLLGIVLDWTKLLNILKNPTGPCCILFAKFLFAVVCRNDS